MPKRGSQYDLPGNGACAKDYHLVGLSICRHFTTHIVQMSQRGLTLCSCFLPIICRETSWIHRYSSLALEVARGCVAQGGVRNELQIVTK
ncbi:hypothetical protein V2G26_017033 [Clonostachys chloroleuca]